MFIFSRTAQLLIIGSATSDDLHNAVPLQTRWELFGTIAIYMHDENQIAKFGASIDAKMAQLHRILPSDLIIAHTSDQPLQVKENIHLFLRALDEAIILVVIVSLIGFREWRLALIMALAIPITFAMTFGVVYMLGIDLQQVSVATLMIALGLLVDVPVVSGDGIKRSLANGLPRSVAAWFGPTKLATAIFYATITNIIACPSFARQLHPPLGQVADGDILDVPAHRSP